MQDRDAILKKIRSLPDTELLEVDQYLDFLEEKKKAQKHKTDALSQVIGICDGPSDLADEHDRYANEAPKLSELEAHVRRGIKQHEADLGKTFDDREKFLDYLRNL
ncbi:MAG TPA: hypothetical protein PLZ44_07225 [Methanothrix sp.]|nr:hypothetical protein [Methanothrix sp.]HPT38064.1 hypothetical protein [Methanothrix sp.]